MSTSQVKSLQKGKQTELATLFSKRFPVGAGHQSQGYLSVLQSCSTSYVQAKLRKDRQYCVCRRSPPCRSQATRKTLCLLFSISETLQGKKGTQGCLHTRHQKQVQHNRCVQCWIVSWRICCLAVIGLTKVVGKEYAETGITCNAVAPAVVRTAMVEAMPDSQVRCDWQSSYILILLLSRCCICFRWNTWRTKSRWSDAAWSTKSQPWLHLSDPRKQASPPRLLSTPREAEQRTSVDWLECSHDGKLASFGDDKTCNRYRFRVDKSLYILNLRCWHSDI